MKFYQKQLHTASIQQSSEKKEIPNVFYLLYDLLRSKWWPCLKFENEGAVSIPLLRIQTWNGIIRESLDTIEFTCRKFGYSAAQKKRTASI